MGDTYLTKANIVLDSIRFVLAFIDWIFYSLLSVIYQIFFNVSSAQIFSGETIMNFFGRIQLILGVFMLFQLTLTILKGVMDPDSFVDKKSGIGNIVQRVAVSMILLACIVPINIPSPANEFERQINNNGLLFGTLYSLQHRVIQNNTLGRLILGTTDDESANYLAGNDKEQLKQAANLFTTTILRGFVKINLVPESDRVHIEGREDETIAENRICNASKFDKFIDIYTDLDSSTNQILGLVHEKCSPSWVGEWFDILGLDKQYVFVYNGFISTIVAVVFIFIFLSLAIDVAVRALKLAILRLLAPIPIISYMDPKGGKDGAFNSWVKLLTTTYLDLFIRLAIIYFIIFLIQDMIINGIVINTTGGIVGGLSVIIIWIGMFIFAKQAPKFIQEMLGLKGGNFSLFSGLGALIGGISAFNASRLGSRAADEAKYREQGLSEDKIKEKMGSFANRGKHLLAGIFGGMGGVSTGYEAVASKDGSLVKAVNTLAKKNAAVVESGEQGGTFFGGVGSTMQQLMFGKSPAAIRKDSFDKTEAEIKKEQDTLKVHQNINSHLKTAIEEVKAKAVDNKNTSGSVTMKNGQTLTANYYDFHSALEAANSNGTGVSTMYVDANNNYISKTSYDALDATTKANYQAKSVLNYNGTLVDMAEATIVHDDLLKANEKDLYAKVLAGASGFTEGFEKITNSINAYNDAKKDPDYNFVSTAPADFGNLKKNYGKQGNKITSKSDEIANKTKNLTDEKQGAAYKRETANANRFNSGGKSS